MTTARITGNYLPNDSYGRSRDENCKIANESYYGRRETWRTVNETPRNREVQISSFRPGEV